MSSTNCSKEGECEQKADAIAATDQKRVLRDTIRTCTQIISETQDQMTVLSNRIQVERKELERCQRKLDLLNMFRKSTAVDVASKATRPSHLICVDPGEVSFSVVVLKLVGTENRQCVPVEIQTMNLRAEDNERWDGLTSLEKDARVLHTLDLTLDPLLEKYSQYRTICLMEHQPSINKLSTRISWGAMGKFLALKNSTILFISPALKSSEQVVPSVNVNELKKIYKGNYYALKRYAVKAFKAWIEEVLRSRISSNEYGSVLKMYNCIKNDRKPDISDAALMGIVFAHVDSRVQ